MGGILLIAAAIFVLFKALHGWRLGVVRQLVNVFAAVAAVFCGILAARIAGPLLSQFAGLPKVVLGPLGGMIAGFAVYCLVVIAGAVLFKRTKDQSVFPVRLLYGAGGAAIGVIYGLLIVATFALGLRVLGTLAETKIAMEKTPYLSAARGTTSRETLPRALAELKRGADRSLLGAWIQRIDPVPSSTYATLGRLGKLVGDSRAIERFLASPELRPVVEHPKVVAIFREPGLNQLVIERHYTALASNPKVVAAIDDPEVMARLRAVDWPKVLDRALRSPVAETP